MQRYDESLVSRKQAARDVKQPLPPSVSPETKDMVETRTVSLLKGQPSVQNIELPPPPGGGERPFEVIGIPLPAGYHVLELASQRLGQSLLNDKYGAQRTMVVRTSALVTNLGVHFKLGRDNSVAWVTTLDTGKPVAGATVQVSDCHGKPVASASTDARGIASFKGISPEAPRCGGGDDENFYADFRNAYFVSARADNQGAQDMAFTWSSWQRGI